MTDLTAQAENAPLRAAEAQIIALQDQVATLKDALTDIATPKVGPDVDWPEEEANKWRAGRWRWAQNTARAALTQEGEQ